MTAATQNSAAVRVAVVQPSLAKYRVPLFANLAGRPGLSLQLFYGTTARRPNADPAGFRAAAVSLHVRHIRGHPLYWQPEQWRQAGRSDLDVLVLNWDVHYATLVPALLRARANGISTVLWGHGISRQDASWRGRPKHWMANLADVLLMYAPRAAQAAIERGWPADRVFVALNALDQGPIQAERERWLADTARLVAFKRSESLHNGPVVLFVSRLDPERRLDLLFHAAAQLIATHPAARELRLVLVGDGPARPSLEALARGLCLPDGGTLFDRVRFVGALYDEAALAPWFMSADAFVYPSYMGLSLLHAFGYGLPVVTSDRREYHGPEVEALVDGENGLLYRDGDANDLGRVLGGLLADADLRRRLGDTALRTVLERYTISRTADGFEAAIRRAATGRRGG